jgi:uncharacterized membrane protein (DUF2068 family)
MHRSRARGDRIVALIGAFKLTKSTLLVTAALGWLLRGPAANGIHALLHAAKWTGALPGHHAVRAAIARLTAIGDHRLRELAIAALCYAAVFAIEGVGLLRRKLWAEWLTVVVTASFLPVEIYELLRHRGPGELVALAINVAIVAYLVRRRLRAGEARAAARRSRLRAA